MLLKQPHIRLRRSQLGGAGPRRRRRQAKAITTLLRWMLGAWTTADRHARVCRTSERDCGQRKGRSRSHSLRTDPALPRAANLARGQLYGEAPPLTPIICAYCFQSDWVGSKVAKT